MIRQGYGKLAKSLQERWGHKLAILLAGAGRNRRSGHLTCAGKGKYRNVDIAPTAYGQLRSMKNYAYVICSSGRRTHAWSEPECS